MLRLFSPRYSETKLFSFWIARCSEVVTKNDIEDYVSKKKGPYVLIDVRNADEVVAGQIPTANHIPCMYKKRCIIF